MRKPQPYWEEVANLRNQGYSWIKIAKYLQAHGYHTEKSIRLLAENTRKTFRYHQTNQNLTMINGQPTMCVKDDIQSFEYKTNGEYVSQKIISLANAYDITPEKLIVLHGLDPSQWEVVNYKNNFWQSQMKGGQLLDLYQSKLTVKPKECLLDENKITEFFDKLDRKFKSFQPIKPLNVCDNETLVEINMSDVHLGRYYFDDTHNIRYNSDYITNIWKSLIKDIVSKLQNYTPSMINFVWCNDFFNSDGKLKTTTGGTPQDTDLDWQELFNLGVSLLIEAIENLKSIAKVTILYTASNHDEMVSWYAIRFLEAWFKNDNQVLFDTHKAPRKYMRFGNTLIGYGHGDRKLAPNKASSLMPVEASADWANTIYREFHLAHLHGEHMIEEINGVIVRRTSSPTFPDLYHIENGFIGNEPKVQLFIYDKVKGLETIHNVRV